jgi:eukaryotic-like serine/threonine-protein kinase
VSPDGSTLAMRGVGQTGWQLFLRPLDRLEAAPIPGTQGAQNPFFSPDGAWIGYWADREIRRVPTAVGRYCQRLAKIAARIGVGGITKMVNQPG